MARNELVIPIRAMATARERILKRRDFAGRINCLLKLQVSCQGSGTRSHRPRFGFAVFRKLELAQAVARIPDAPEKLEDSARGQERPAPPVCEDVVVRVRVQGVEGVPVHGQADEAAQRDPA